jgi:hypothetical protein
MEQNEVHMLPRPVLYTLRITIVVKATPGYEHVYYWKSYTKMDK